MTLDTLAAPATHEIDVKHSRFLARAIRVDDPAEAAGWLQLVSVADATHNCWAWRIGDDYRSSDDGEPAGTAGRPILAAIDGQGFDRVVVVVTRWFGGTLLGAGGLVRAYSDAVRAGVEAAGVRRRELRAEFLVDLDHGVAGRVESDLRTRGYAVLETTYSAQVRLRLGVPHDQAETLIGTIAELTGGVSVPQPVGESWVDADTRS